MKLMLHSLFTFITANTAELKGLAPASLFILTRTVTLLRGVRPLMVAQESLGPAE